MHMKTTSSSSSPFASRTPIGPDDVVEVVGRYLVYKKSNSTHRPRRFVMKGMAFPTPPLTSPRDDADPQEQLLEQYNPKGWIAVLEQLAHDMPDLNTVRIYRMNNCSHIDYSEFLTRAAELGIYVMVPLTAVSGPGVLNRDKDPPSCYKKELFLHGISCIHQFWNHPNVLAGMIGNEVMNSLLTWKAAPCVMAYGRDLKAYMRLLSNTTSTSSSRRMLPLVYAAQHDSPDAALLPEDAMKLTVSYLSCVDKTTTATAMIANKEEELSLSSVDIYGMNVESWCSSLQTFEFDEDGITETAYHALYRTMRHNVSIPIVFSEVGCSKELFNRDNGLARHVRDWRQIPVLLQPPMVDVFSGFCAYTYDGNPLFRMMGGQEMWDGVHVLKPSPDYENFCQQLHIASSTSFLEEEQDKVVVKAMRYPPPPRPSCEDVMLDLKRYWKLDLVPVSAMPSYMDHYSKFLEEHPDAAGGGGGFVVQEVNNNNNKSSKFFVVLLMAALAVVIVGYVAGRLRRYSRRILTWKHDDNNVNSNGDCGDGSSGENENGNGHQQLLVQHHNKEQQYHSSPSPAPHTNSPRGPQQHNSYGAVEETKNKMFI